MLIGRRGGSLGHRNLTSYGELRDRLMTAVDQTWTELFLEDYSMLQKFCHLEVRL